MSHMRIQRSEAIDDLFYALLSLRDIEECYALFSDMFTVQELTAFSQRLQVARMLMEGKTYKMVQNSISISASTITRINTELHYGCGGYRMVLDRLPQIRRELEGE